MMRCLASAHSNTAHNRALGRRSCLSHLTRLKADLGVGELLKATGATRREVRSCCVAHYDS